MAAKKYVYVLIKFIGNHRNIPGVYDNILIQSAYYLSTEDELKYIMLKNCINVTSDIHSTTAKSNDKRFEILYKKLMAIHNKSLQIQAIYTFPNVKYCKKEDIRLNIIKKMIDDNKIITDYLNKDLMYLFCNTLEFEVTGV
jgi:hypothetical protein